MDIVEWLNHRQLGKCVVTFKRAKIELQDLGSLNDKGINKLGLERGSLKTVEFFVTLFPGPRCQAPTDPHNRE